MKKMSVASTVLTQDEPSSEEEDESPEISEVNSDEEL